MVFQGIATYDLTEKVGIGAGLDINSHSFNATGSTNYRAGAVKNIDLSAQFTVILKFYMSVFYLKKKRKLSNILHLLITVFKINEKFFLKNV